MRPLLLIFSGPAGSGKTTICDRLLATMPNQLTRIVTATSRAPRSGEKDGVDYWFFSPEEFERKIAAGDFYEYAKVHGRHYGALKSEIDGKLQGSQDVLLNIDVQGVENYQLAAKNNPLLAERMVTIFIKPPNMDELRRRLKSRGSDDETEIERRMQTAVEELKQWKLYDHCIESSDKESDFNAAVAIYNNEKQRKG